MFRGGVLEQITVRLGPGALRIVATASEVRVRVCDDAWTLSPELMRAVRGIGRRLGYTRPARAAQAPVPRR